MGKLADIKTKPTLVSVESFIDSIAQEQKRKDSYTLLAMMEKAMNEKPAMWGTSIIGFGNKIYKSPATDREVDWFIIGFSPRKANLSLYLNISLQANADMLQQLGKHKTGAGCIYINKLQDIDVKVLEKLIDKAAK